jgi:hypothetical protein
MGLLAEIRAEVLEARRGGYEASVRIPGRAWAAARREYSQRVGAAKFRTVDVFGAPVSIVGAMCKTRVLAKRADHAKREDND